MKSIKHVAVLLAMALSSCYLWAQTNDYNEQDPWEPLNRKLFAFNDTADHYILLPIAKGYQWVTPNVLQAGVGNFYSNLSEITTIANDLLQFKFYQAASDAARFVINTTVGVGGLFDVATKMGLQQNREDFGQTLARWGVYSGPYIVVPFLGPRTIRSGVGTLVDAYYTDPLWRFRMDAKPRYALIGLRYINNRADFIESEQLITGDEYIFIRDAYLQRREYLINDGAVVDTFGEEDYEDWAEWE